MSQHRLWRVAAAVVIILIVDTVLRNQVKVYKGREARAAMKQQQHPVLPERPDIVQQRQQIFALLHPAAITNCRLDRFGEAHDGGYLMCGNLLGTFKPATRTGSEGTTNGVATSRTR